MTIHEQWKLPEAVGNPAYSEESRRSQATASETMEAKEIATTAVAETAVAEAPAQVFDKQSCKRAAQTPRPYYILES